MSGVPTATWIGRELASGRYRVDALLGEGGMGAVYRAWDKNLGTEVVVKVPHAAMLHDAEFAARFAREISSLVRLSHPHIVKISDVGEQDGLPFAVMQFLPGGSLEDRQKSGPNGNARSLPPDSLKPWLPSIAEALDFVHSQGYIHRDVKPANILFDAHGHAYLSDFGIAKSAITGQPASTKTLTGSGMVIGTPEYMAPELIMGQSCDGRVDQYALAITVFEMLAGRRPFEDSTSTALYVQHATAEPPDLTTLSPNVSMAITAAIHRALSKSPEQRFASCRAFATVLLGAAETFTASQTDAVETKCPVCQRSLKLADRMRGKQLRCAGCHSLLDVSDDLRLMLVLSPANETAARATTRLASGIGSQAILSAVEAGNSYRLQPDQDSPNKGAEPVPAKSPTSATQRAASLGEATLRSMSGKTIRPSMLPSPKTKSPATQHEPQTATQPWMSVVGKLLRQFKSDFQAFARRHPTRVAAVVWGVVLVSIPPLMMLIFQTDESSLDPKLQSDPPATKSAPQPTDAKQPIPIPNSELSQPIVAKTELPAQAKSEENPGIKTVGRESLDAKSPPTAVDPVKVGLEEARSAYEERLQSAKKVLLERLNVLMNAASKEGNPAKAKTIQSWRDVFERDGWFAIPTTEMKDDVLEYGRVTHEARQAFLGAYEDAMAASRKAGELDKASQLQNEKIELRLASRLVSLQCYRKSGVFVQHANLQAVTPPVVDRLNATLEMVPGLSDQNHVSFRSVNLPDHYLAHGDFQFLFRKLNSADPVFRRNSTFMRRAPLAQGAGNLAVSYEAVTHAGFFIRAKNSVLRLERNDGSTQFRSDATFIITEPQFPIWDESVVSPKPAVAQANQPSLKQTKNSGRVPPQEFDFAAGTTWIGLGVHTQSPELGKQFDRVTLRIVQRDGTDFTAKSDWTANKLTEEVSGSDDLTGKIAGLTAEWKVEKHASFMAQSQLRDDVLFFKWENPPHTGETVFVPELTFKDRMRFAGKYRISEKNVFAFELTLAGDGSAKKSHAPDDAGAWMPFGDGVLAVWRSGWRDILVKESGTMIKKAFRPGSSVQDEPINMGVAEKIE